MEDAGEAGAARFLRDLTEAVPHRVRAALTDDGVRFATRARDVRDGRRVFDRVREERGVERRPAKVDHPRTDGRVERTDRTLKDATVERCRHESCDRLRAHLRLFADAYDHARRLKALHGLTPRELVHQA